MRDQRRRVDRASPATRAFASIAQTGKIGAELAWRLDMVRATRGTAGLRQLRARGGNSEVATRWNAFYRRIWEHAADAVGAEVDDLTAGFLAIRQAQQSTIVWQSQVMLDNPVTLRLALNKPIGSGLLTRVGLPVPKHVEFASDDLRPALTFLAESNEPCVIKPASGTGGGQGVTCGVVDVDDLVRACVRTRRWDKRALMERQAAGDEYRLLFLDGELLDVIRRRSPTLVGNGRSTVEELIQAENERRWNSQGRAGLSSIDVDLDCLLTLRASGLSLTAVPPSGWPVRIKSAVNAGGPSDTETVHDMCSGVIAEASLAARVIGVRLAGVDIITPDPTRPLREAGGVIVEVNGTPGLHYHYLVADVDQATPVAVPILAKLFASGRPADPDRDPAMLNT
jgi:cyanophycin synthetase